jgi:hypothetical protein
MLGDASRYDLSTPSVRSRSKHMATARRAVWQSSREGAPIEVDPAIVTSWLKRRQRPPTPGIATLPWPVCWECRDPVPAEPDPKRPRARLCQGARRRDLGATVAAGRGARNTHTDEAQLNRGGNRQANAALYRVVVVRMRWHEPTIRYMKKRTTDGLSKKDIIQCLKR